MPANPMVDFDEGYFEKEVPPQQTKIQPKSGARYWALDQCRGNG